MNDKELIEELREYATALRASVHVPHTGADLIERGADALAARQPTEDAREALAKVLAQHRPSRWRSCSNGMMVLRCCGKDFGRLSGKPKESDRSAEELWEAHVAEALSRAAVPDAATEELEVLRGIAETHALCADRLSIETERADRVAREVCDRGCSYTGGPDEECSAHGRTPRELWEFIAQDVVGRDAATERAEKAEAERDTALAAVAAVRAIHVRDTPSIGGDWCLDDHHKWPCPTVAALDGAPEPELVEGTPERAALWNLPGSNVATSAAMPVEGESKP